jgi:hypothetical protein
MDQKEPIHYVEFGARDLPATKSFFAEAFGWTFVDYGPDYASIQNAGLDGGFFTSDKQADADTGSALVILYSATLEDARDRVLKAGGTIKKAIFSFPGGRRFHFVEPSGNELAVWSDRNADGTTVGED